MLGKNFYVYIMTNKRNGTLYIGMTTDLLRRVYERREGLIRGFTSRYGLKMIVRYEAYDSVTSAIQRETNLKRWPRKWKLALIENEEPAMARDLHEEIGLSSPRPTLTPHGRA